ncbi:hypothetical protein SESBI_28341 [Sesbania bispinosa]|nr:hypothetical protein SESBI_28341 [Sesbania bispinosa]
MEKESKTKREERPCVVRKGAVAGGRRRGHERGGWPWCAQWRSYWQQLFAVEMKTVVTVAGGAVRIK